MADATLFPDPPQVKRCTTCGVEKPTSEFNKGRAYCRPCHVAAAMEWNKNNPDKRRAYHRKWSLANKDLVLEYGRRSYRRMSPEKKAAKAAKQYPAHIRRRYGLTVEELATIREKQDDRCALCRREGKITTRRNKLFVDHNHATGRVRGLLCLSCNQALGVLGDSVERLDRVVRYLRGQVIDV